jgi:hypothetical protein
VWGRTPHEVIAATQDWLGQREKEITESIRKTNRVRNALSDFTAGVAYQGFIIDSAKRGIAG